MTFFHSFKTFRYAAFDSDTTACSKLKHLFLLGVGSRIMFDLQHSGDFHLDVPKCFLWESQPRSARCPMCGIHHHLVVVTFQPDGQLCGEYYAELSSKPGKFSPGAILLQYISASFICLLSEKIPRKKKCCREVCPCITAGEATWATSIEWKMWYERELVFIRYCWMQNTCKCDSWMSCTQFEKQVEEFWKENTLKKSKQNSWLPFWHVSYSEQFKQHW